MTVQPLKTIVLDLLEQGHQDSEDFLQNLSETERVAIGTPHLWAAKDHLAHRTFWHRRRLTAIQHHPEIVESEEDADQLNSRNFEEHRLRPFSEISVEAERVYTELITTISHLGEEDLTTPGRFPSISGERPLYTAFLGGCYEHEQEHLAQYYSDRHNFPRATQIREKCVSRILEAEVPEWVKGSFLYHLACFYAQHNKLEQAALRLQEAVALAPGLKEHSNSDPELIALRNQEEHLDPLWKTALWQQFGAAIDMLENALVTCPTTLWRERLWNTPSATYLPPEFSEFWYLAYHTLFWLDFYLSGTREEEEFAPPAPFIWTEIDAPVSPEQPYTKEELHSYLVVTRQKCHTMLSALTDELACQPFSYPWTKGQAVSFLEVQLYIMRHSQEHAAQLNMFLGQHGIEGVSDWVSRVSADAGDQV